MRCAACRLIPCIYIGNWRSSETAGTGKHCAESARRRCFLNPSGTPASLPPPRGARRTMCMRNQKARRPRRLFPASPALGALTSAAACAAACELAAESGKRSACPKGARTRRAAFTGRVCVARSWRKSSSMRKMPKGKTRLREVPWSCFTDPTCSSGWTDENPSVRDQ